MKKISTLIKQDIAITIDIVIFSIVGKTLKVLLSKRNIDPFKGKYALPGGFLENSSSIDENAKIILKKDTNISSGYLEQLYTFGELNRDPRGRVISIIYYALLDSKTLKIQNSNKSDSIDWFSLSELKKLSLAFDHKKIINEAIERIKNKIEYTNIAFQLLPEKFTLGELQEVYEIILERELDKRNFRKKINELEMLIELNEFKKQGRMRPAQYFKFKERTKETILKEKKVWV